MSVANERALAAHLVNAVLIERRSLSQAAVDGRFAGVEAPRQAAARNLAFGSLRLAGRLRHMLGQLSERPLDPPELLGHLLVGLFELDTEAAPAYAVVNETVANAGQLAPRARGFVNALLRNFQRRRPLLAAEAERNESARWNLPGWWLQRLRREWPQDWQRILVSQAQHPPMTLRVNRRRLRRDDYLSRLQALGRAARPLGEDGLRLAEPCPVSELPGFAEGWVSVQDYGAQLAADLLAAADGLRVLDACAAPGGKTGHLLERHDLDLVALDSVPERLARVDDNLHRLGLSAQLLCGDAGRPADWWDGRPFDRILLDAPCTASGVLRRHPDARWLKRGEDAQQLSTEQARLLDALWPLLKPGGKMLYATCSLYRAENADQAAAFLRRHADAGGDPLELPGGFPVEATGGQLLPDDDSDGFFYARFTKA
jgi:16S rRNA (cytosine967-C5)-methyltransferase